MLNTFCSLSNQGVPSLQEEQHLSTNNSNNSQQKLVSPRLSAGRVLSSFFGPCCDVKSFCKPSNAEGDIFTGSGMKAAILASNSFNVSLLINIQRTNNSRCLPTGGNVAEKIRVSAKKARPEVGF